MADTDDNPQRISDAELAVMEALWEAAPRSAAEVADTVGEARSWSLATVKTLLSRLVTKGAIRAEPDGKRYLYHPVLAQADYLGAESQRVVDKLFGGRAAPLFAHLVEAEALSAQDLDEIEALLKEIRR